MNHEKDTRSDAQREADGLAARLNEHLSEDTRWPEDIPDDEQREDEDEIGVGSLCSNAYDIEYQVDNHKEYRSVKLMVACGGPNIWIDTGSGSVRCSWWFDKGEARLDDRVVDIIDDFMREMYNCL